MSTDLKSTEISTLIEGIVSTWRTMIEARGVTLTCFIDEAVSGEYNIEAKKFHACLNTLLSNAAHYTDNGRVHVHVTAKEKPQSNSRNLTIIIADTGRGISNEQQIDLLRGESNARLSEIMQTAKDLGGKITFNSALGRGSEFTFKCLCPLSNVLELETEVASLSAGSDQEYIDIDIDYEDIPIHAPEKPAKKIETPVPTKFNPDNLRGLRVLIVDDVSSNQDVIKIFLEPEGCKCFCTAAGEEALETLKTQAVDVILMDIRMPGMSGIETTQAIRNGDLAAKNVPIIALTADSSAETNAACMAAGADLFLTKPVLCRDLLEAIRFVRRYQEDTPSKSRVA